MKILALHVDYIKFKPLKKALKDVEELSEENKKQTSVKDALVVLTAIEKQDDSKIINEFVKNIKDIAGQVKTKKIVLYPYSHLSNNLAPPETATKVLEEAENELKKNFSVVKAPFGYYKEFEVKVKGHPLSELSRDISAGKEKISQIKNEKAKKELEETEADPKNLLRGISKSILDRSKLESYDHRILGQEMDLFSFNDVSPGAPFWHPNGLVIYNELINFMRKLCKKFEYQEISTPFIYINKLWKISGHWGYYRDNIFLTSYEEKEAALKPMNCPPAMLIYRLRPRSYKELPLRLAEFGVVHRKELSGVLAGLFRVVKLTMDDAHIFCTKEQIESEVETLFKMFKIVYEDTFKFSYSVELSTRPERFLGKKEEWDFTEKALEAALKKSKIKYKIKKGEGAFYGPKIDIHIKDSLGRNWQMTTIQLDMQMPQRFDLKYVDRDGKEKTPLVIHRAILGTLERFIGILLEHTKGRLPVWLAPVQVRVLSFTDRNEKYAREAILKLINFIPELRINADFRNIPIQIKVKDAELMKVPYIIVAGDKEEENKTLALRIKGNKEIKTMKIEELANVLKNDIEKKL